MYIVVWKASRDHKYVAIHALPDLEPTASSSEVKVNGMGMNAEMSAQYQDPNSIEASVSEMVSKVSQQVRVLKAYVEEGRFGKGLS